jgi:hypothetical protein
MNSGDVVKAFIRNQIFHEVDASNKKVGAITSSSIAAVFWPVNKKLEEVPLKDWIKIAEDAAFWGLE